MDKNNIKNRLTKRFISEDITPGISITNKVKKDNAKINKDGVNAVGKDAIEYNKNLKKDSDANKMSPNKFNYNDDKEKVYHDEIEIMNGQEMVQYDRKPNKTFQERAEEAIAGSSRMGNNPEWANVVDKQQGFEGPEFGSNLVKKIKASEKKRGEQTKPVYMYGDDWEVTNQKSHKSYAFESPINEMASLKKPISEKTTQILTAWVTELGSQKAAEKLINKLSQTGMISDLPDSMEYGTGLNKVSALLEKGDLNNAYHTAKAIATRLEKKAMKDMGLFENNNNKTKIKESMKRLKFKSEFNGLGNALKLIPESYKIDKKVFEMTDGVENYKIRWEGNNNNGKAIVLTAVDKNLVSEDIARMKALFGYKSQDTLGLVKGNARIDENKAFSDIWKKSRVLLGESDEIDGYKTKEGDLDDAVSHASEAKEHVEGSVSTEKGTKAPASKQGDWDKNVKGQAAEAKAHVHLKENEVEEEIMETEEDLVSSKKGYVREEEEEEEEEVEDSYNKEEEEEEEEEVEPSANELPTEPELDGEEEEEEVVKVPAKKSGDSTILYSASADEYWIQSPSIPTGRMKVPDEYISIAADKSKKAAQRAEMILDMMENEEADEYGDETQGITEAVSPEAEANLEKQFDELNTKLGGTQSANKMQWMQRAKDDNYQGSFSITPGRVDKRTKRQLPPVLGYSSGSQSVLQKGAKAMGFDPKSVEKLGVSKVFEAK